MFPTEGLKTRKPQCLLGFSAFYCDPAGIRTQDPYIKSVMLYQLSYGIITIVKIGVQIYHHYLIYKNYFGVILSLNLV